MEVGSITEEVKGCSCVVVLHIQWWCRWFEVGDDAVVEMVHNRGEGDVGDYFCNRIILYF